jgi:hypothetical protein
VTISSGAAVSRSAMIESLYDSAVALDDRHGLILCREVKILLDHNLDWRISNSFTGHEVSTTLEIPLPRTTLPDARIEPSQKRLQFGIKSHFGSALVRISVETVRPGSMRRLARSHHLQNRIHREAAHTPSPCCC